MIRLASPWLLAVGIPLVLLVLLRLRRLPAEHAGTRRRVIQGLMAAAALCAALALAGLEVGSRTDRMAVVFALDTSRSVQRGSDEATADASDALRDAVGSMRADDRAGLVVFGAEATTEILPSPEPPIGTSRAAVPRDGTDIGAGLRRALADLPAGHAGRIVLVSDGVQTEGDALGAATAAAGRGVQIDVLPIEREAHEEVAVERVRVPATARPEEPVDVRIVTRATRETDVRVTVLRDDRPIAKADATVGQGHDVLVLHDEAPEAGVHRYDVVVDPKSPDTDVSRENNEGGAFMRVVGGSRALVLAGEPAQAEALGEAIERGGLEVQVRGPSGVPVTLGELASWDLVVLSDLEARALLEEQMTALRAYVRDLGGGLIMTGARDSFGLGGYAYTPVEEVLPATFDLRKRKDRMTLAMVIAIDKSGSMMMEVSPGTTKLDLANEAASRSARLLSATDRVGVMHVDTAVGWTLPMSPVEDPAKVAAAIHRAQPGGGGIYVDVALEESYDALEAQATQLKHLLLFSDGQDSEKLQGTEEQVRRAKGHGITSSVVSMGRGQHSAALERLSRIGDGRFYIVEDMRELPRIFTQETIEASRAALKEEPFRAERAAPGAAVRGIDFASAPALQGYAVVNARPRASVLLEAKDDDPLLMTWQKGVGRSAVFATDAGAELARPWLEWPGYGALFSQLARAVARSADPSDTSVGVSVEGGVGKIRMDAVDADGRYRNHLDVEATVAGPGGRRLEVPLQQTGPGRYEGEFDASAPGPYLLGVSEEGRGLVATAGVVRPRADELGGEGTDRAMLARIAALTGGEVRTDLEGLFRDRPPPTWAHTPAWPWLLAAALCLLLLSVAARRLVLPADALRRAVPAPLRKLLRMRPARERAPAPDPTATLDALSRSRARREAERGGGGPEQGRAEQVGGAADGQAGVAPEIRQAQAAAPPAGHAAEPEGRGGPQDEARSAQPGAGEDDGREGARGSGDGGGGGGDGGGGDGDGGASGSSLAEQLLARKKRRR